MKIIGIFWSSCDSLTGIAGGFISGALGVDVFYCTRIILGAGYTPVLL